MNAIELLKPTGDGNAVPCGVWCCGKCRNVHATKTGADSCCIPPTCKSCGDAMPEVMRYHAMCSKCAGRQYDEKRAAKLAAAELVEGWDGWVYSDDYQGGNEGYFTDVDAFVEHLECEDVSADEWPERVWCCDEIPFPGINLEQAIENACEDLHEDAQDQITDESWKELDAAADKFREANKHIVSYQCGKKATLVPKQTEAKS